MENLHNYAVFDKALLHANERQKATAERRGWGDAGRDTAVVGLRNTGRAKNIAAGGRQRADNGRGIEEHRAGEGHSGGREARGNPRNPRNPRKSAIQTVCDEARHGGLALRMMAAGRQKPDDGRGLGNTGRAKDTAAGGWRGVIRVIRVIP